MAGICLPIDASGGAPAFPAAQHRAAQAALMTGSPDRPLGARSGVRPTSVPTLTLSGLNWSLSPFNGVLDPGTGLAVGPYLFAFLANETGTLNPQDATYPRIDRIDVQVPDDPPGALPRAAVIKYTTGTPASSPVAPSAPAQSLPLGSFSVPKSGSGNPSFTASIPMAVAAGGILPVSGAYPASPYRGQVIDDAVLGLLRWNGTAWKSVVDTEYETGTTTISSVVGQQNATKAVPFAKTWSAAPMVQLTIRGGAAWAASLVGAPTTTGFTAMVAKTDGSNAGGVVGFVVDWLAIRRTA